MRSLLAVACLIGSIPSTGCVLLGIWELPTPGEEITNANFNISRDDFADEATLTGPEVWPQIAYVQDYSIKAHKDTNERRILLQVKMAMHDVDLRLTRVLDRNGKSFTVEHVDTNISLSGGSTWYYSLHFIKLPEAYLRNNTDGLSLKLYTNVQDLEEPILRIPSDYIRLFLDNLNRL